MAVNQVKEWQLGLVAAQRVIAEGMTPIESTIAELAGVEPGSRVADGLRGDWQTLSHQLASAAINASYVNVKKVVIEQICRVVERMNREFEPGDVARLLREDYSLVGDPGIRQWHSPAEGAGHWAGDAVWCTACVAAAPAGEEAKQ